MADLPVRLRPIREPDFEMLTRILTDPTASLPFQWFGFRSPQVFRRRWEEDGFLDQDPHYLAVADSEDRPIGWVMWRQGVHGKQAGVWEIGALLLPEHRGQGAGTAAQRLLVDHLFATTSAHRIWAGTQVENLAEQRALEKCGFQREGLLREAVFYNGNWRDGLLYGLLRHEFTSPG